MISKVWSILALTGLASAAASMPVSVAQSETINRTQGNIKTCELPRGWSSISSRHPIYIIFGEEHGTKESPDLFYSITCALAHKGEHILVAVEYSSSHNDDLQKAWALPDFEFQDMFIKYYWAGREDGIASQATLSMLRKLHSLKGQGGSIDIVAFNGARDMAQQARFANLPGQGPHEAAQAENIRNAAEAGAYDHVLVLVGSLHASKVPVTKQGVRFDPMAVQLGPAAKIVSLRMAHDAGTAWNCQLKKADAQLEPGAPIPANAVDCGLHHVSANTEYRGSPNVGLGSLPKMEASPAYDGFFWVGSISASPPAALPANSR
ncbi:hypothetical protein [Sphingomonas oryzagri]